MIEQFTDGTAAFFSAREQAWHGLGTVTEGALTADEALKVAQLDWEVFKSEDPVATPVKDIDGNTFLLPMENKFLTYRFHPKTQTPQALGVVGAIYEPWQNREAFSFLNYLVDEFGAVFETAGSLNNGKQVFMTLKMPRTITVGDDQIDLYIVAYNYHDGTGAFNVIATPIRVVCKNTLAWGIQAAKSSWSIRHTKGAKAEVQAARETLGFTFNYADEFEKEAATLLAQPMSEKGFNMFVDTLVPMPKDEDKTDRIEAKVQATRDSIKTLWVAPTQQSIKGTKWAALNAVVEWADWVKPVKGSLLMTEEQENELRAVRTMTDSMNAGRSNRPLDIKRKAYRLLADDKGSKKSLVTV